MTVKIQGPLLWCDYPKLGEWVIVYERIDENHSRVVSLESDNQYIVENRYILWT
jgi:hypothetical protein